MIRLNSPDLFQWDTGRYVIIYPPANYPNIKQVEFSNEDDKYAEAVEVVSSEEGYTAIIPNTLLQQPDRLFCYAVYYDSDNNRSTSERKIFNIIERAKPEDYSTAIEHDKLINRDVPNSHPISAITGLTDALANTLTKKVLDDKIASLVSNTPIASINDGIITIPKNILEVAGIIKASDEKINFAKIASTGNINDLVQTNGDDLVLNCGGAKKGE